MAKRTHTFRLRPTQIFRSKISLLFAAVFVVVGGVVVYFSFASGVTVVHGDPDYWRPRIAACESGGSYTAINSAGYYGAYQFDIGTWNGYGGYTRPDQAPPAVQDAKFNETFARRGSNPWNSSYFCWSRGTAIVTPPPPPAFIPRLTNYNVTVSGKIIVNGAGAAGVGIGTCGNTPADFRTDANGNYGFIIAAGTDFCIRIGAGLPAGAVLSATNNQLEHKTAASYENQVAGQDNYHDLWQLFSATYSWDRSTDSGYDFAYMTQ